MKLENFVNSRKSLLKATKLAPVKLRYSVNIHVKDLFLGTFSAMVDYESDFENYDSNHTVGPRRKEVLELIPDQEWRNIANVMHFLVENWIISKRIKDLPQAINVTYSNELEELKKFVTEQIAADRPFSKAVGLFTIKAGKYTYKFEVTTINEKVALYYFPS